MQFDFFILHGDPAMAKKINGLRAKKNLRALNISIIEYQMEEDEICISSTRISEGKIDENDRILSA